MIEHSSQTLPQELVANTILQKIHLLYTIDLPVRGALMPKSSLLKHVMHKC
jgi:hypothetical protein